MEKALTGVLVNTFTPEHLREIMQLVQLDEECKVDFKLFAGLAAMTERLLYTRFL